MNKQGCKTDITVFVGCDKGAGIFSFCEINAVNQHIYCVCWKM